MSKPLLWASGLTGAIVLMHLSWDGFGSMIRLLACGVMLIAAWEMWRNGGDDRSWRWMAGGVLGWVLGDLVWALMADNSPSVPSWPDIGYVMLPVGLCIGLYRWGQWRYAVLTWRIALDGLVVGVACGALVATLVFPQLLKALEAVPLQLAFGLIYPVADLVLLMFVVLLLGRGNWVFERSLLLIGGALICLFITDTGAALQTAQIGARTSSVFDVGWLIGTIFLAWASKCPAETKLSYAPSRWATITLPAACALIALGLLSFSRFQETPLAAWMMASATLALVVVRLLIAYVERDEAYREQARQERLLRDLLADMSHELRTPLTNILGQLEELDDRTSKTQNEAEYSHSLRSALRSSRKMDKLIEELLLLARAQSRNLDAARLGSWSNLVKNAIDETELQGIQHTLQLDLRPTSIRGDAPALTNALVNLLINAYRHTPPSSQISIQSWESAENVLLRIRDNGPGISEEMRERIWERYVKGEHPDSTGIGLALVKAIIEAHDGNIILEESKQGSSFLISLPRASESIGSQETGSSPEDSTVVADTHSSAWQ